MSKYEMMNMNMTCMCCCKNFDFYTAYFSYALC